MEDINKKIIKLMISIKKKNNIDASLEELKSSIISEEDYLILYQSLNFNMIGDIIFLSYHGESLESIKHYFYDFIDKWQRIIDNRLNTEAFKLMIDLDIDNSFIFSLNDIEKYELCKKLLTIYRNTSSLLLISNKDFIRFFYNNIKNIIIKSENFDLLDKICEELEIF